MLSYIDEAANFFEDGSEFKATFWMIVNYFEDGCGLLGGRW